MLNPKALVRLFEPFLRPLRNRIMTMIARGVLLSLKDSEGIQLAKVQLLAGEIRDDLERVQNFGMTSNPPPSSELVAVFVGGNREHGFVIAAEPRDVAGTRPSVLPGETAIYSATPGHQIKLSTGGFISIENSTVDLVKSYDRVLQALAAEPFIVNKATFTAESLLMQTMKAP